MTLPRTIVILLGALGVMLCVVLLRAETTRLHNEVSRCENRTARLRQRLHVVEAEVARLRNPMVIRARAEEILGEIDAGTD